MGGESMSDERIIGLLYRHESLDELLQSIAVNGYLDIEPLIVVDESNDEQLTVLEGNRRLAAIRLLCDPRLRERIREADGPNIRVPALAPEHADSLQNLSVYLVKDRDEARPFIGFKHVNGVAKWNPYAKARYAAKWHEETGEPIELIANRVGDKHETVKRMVVGIYVLDQARAADVFDIEDRYTVRLNFSHIYTALARSDFRQFLQMPSAWADIDPTPTLVPESRLKQLGEVLRWMYGSKSNDQAPVVRRQNPDIKRLGEVLANDEALMTLRARGSLRDAHPATKPRLEKLSYSLVEAHRQLGDAVNSISALNPHDKVLGELVEDISTYAGILVDRIRKSGSVR